ncbi:hypothetical protein ACLBWP_08770 [Microbacterium sp. M1A1_1b]|uniref:hypothetical protein n=1 Tax=Curtobacterium sp. VKM Ac-2922 TaxID=2929475 RepID=UPI001FB43993|nr:hypothetical protein [Curtobacterium sp. VKM Ac-2922]MCJ1713988.1 hypothetical protein [Curtobacterium sp. VKM Ac-2922]
MNDASGMLLVRLGLLGTAVLVLVAVLSFSPCEVCVVAAVVLGLAAAAAGLVGAMVLGRR